MPSCARIPARGMDRPQLLYSFVNSRTLGLFPPLAVVNSAAVTTGVRVLCGCVPRSPGDTDASERSCGVPWWLCVPGAVAGSKGTCPFHVPGPKQACYSVLPQVWRQRTVSKDICHCPQFLQIRGAFTPSRLLTSAGGLSSAPQGSSNRNRAARGAGLCWSRSSDPGVRAWGLQGGQGGGRKGQLVQMPRCKQGN